LPPAPEPKVEAPKVDIANVDLGDISLDTSSTFTTDVEIGIGEVIPAPVEVKPAPVAEPAPVKVEVKPEPPAPPKTNGHIEPGQVLRWTIRAELNAYNMRKLHGICIITEGNVGLRVISLTGDVLIDESSGVKVNPQEFLALTSLFGLS
jgi:hypothetical protein